MTIDVGAVIGLFIFLIGQLVTGVWWASKMTTTLGILVKQVDALARAHEGYMTTAEHNKDIVRIEKDILNIWKRLDTPHACPNANNHRG